MRLSTCFILRACFEKRFYLWITVYVTSTSCDRILDDDAARSRRRSRGQLVNRFDNRDRDLWLRTILARGIVVVVVDTAQFVSALRAHRADPEDAVRPVHWLEIDGAHCGERERGIWRDFISSLLRNCVLFSRLIREESILIYVFMIIV